MGMRQDLAEGGFEHHFGSPWPRGVHPPRIRGKYAIPWNRNVYAIITMLRSLLKKGIAFCVEERFEARDLVLS